MTTAAHRQGADAPDPAVPTAGSTVLRRRFAALDGLRAVGALMVVVTHVSMQTATNFTEPFGGLLARFDVGVPLFFAISGFLLYRPYVEARLTGSPAPHTGGYLWRRALRILPVLWITVLAVGILLHRGTPVDLYLRHMLLVHIYSPDNWVRGLTQMWSLAVEVAFYLVLPLLAWLLMRTARSPRGFVRRSLIVLAGLVVVSQLWVYGTHVVGHSTASQWLPSYLGWFAVGMALVTWQQARCLGLLPVTRVDDLARQPWTLWLMGLAILLIVATPVAGSYGLETPSPGQAVFKNLAYTAFALLLVLPCVAGLRDGDDGPPARALGGRVGRFLGDISYGVFAYHLLAMELMEDWLELETFAGGFWRLLLPTLAVTIPVAALSYRFVERPMMRWGQRIYSRR